MSDDEVLAELVKQTDLLTEIHETLELSGADGATGAAADPRPGAVISLSYVLRQAQLTGQLGVQMKALLQNTLSWYAHNQGVRDPYFSSSKWTKDDMKLCARYSKDSIYGWQDHNGQWDLTYSWVSIDPDESGYVDESANVDVVGNQPYEHKGHGFLLDLTDADSPLSFERTESVTETQERSVSMTNTTELDVGVSSETTVGGSLAGVSVEEKISASFGYKDTEEQAKAQSESQSKTVEVKIAYEAQPKTATLLTVESNDIHALTPFDWNGSVNYGIVLRGWHPVFDTTWGNYMAHSSRAKRIDGGAGDDDFSYWWEITFHDWDDFLSFWQGTNTDFPGSLNKNLGGAAGDALNALMNPDLRYISLKGTEHRHYQDGAEMKVQDVTGGDLATIAAQHGAQIVRNGTMHDYIDTLSEDDELLSQWRRLSPQFQQKLLDGYHNDGNFPYLAADKMPMMKAVVRSMGKT